MSDISESTETISDSVPQVEPQSSPVESGNPLSEKTIWQQKKEERAQVNVSNPTSAEFALAQPQTVEDQIAWRRKQKQQDEELSLIMQGKKKKMVEGAEDSEGNKQEVFVIEDDSDAPKTMDERKVRVIDKKTDFLMETAKEKFGEDVGAKETEKVLTEVFGSKEKRDELREKVKQEMAEQGKDLNSPQTKAEIEAEVDKGVQAAVSRFKESAIGKAMGGAERAQALVNANIDFETFVLFLVGEEVGGGRYRATPDGEDREENVDLPKLVEFMENKKRHFRVALKMCGSSQTLEDWREDEKDPAKFAELANILDMEVYPSERKSLQFMNGLLISLGKTDEANALADSSKAQEQVKSISKVLSRL